jgi:hypothetical protein
MHRAARGGCPLGSTCFCGLFSALRRRARRRGGAVGQREGPMPIPAKLILTRASCCNGPVSATLLLHQQPGLACSSCCPCLRACDTSPTCIRCIVLHSCASSGSADSDLSQAAPSPLSRSSPASRCSSAEFAAAAPINKRPPSAIICITACPPPRRPAPLRAPQGGSLPAALRRSASPRRRHAPAAGPAPEPPWLRRR